MQTHIYKNHNFATNQHQRRGKIHRYFPSTSVLICYNLFELQKKESDSKKLEKKYCPLLPLRKECVRYAQKKNLIKLFVWFYLQVFSLENCMEVWYITVGMFISSHELTHLCKVRNMVTPSHCGINHLISVPIQIVRIPKVIPFICVS